MNEFNCFFINLSTRYTIVCCYLLTFANKYIYNIIDSLRKFSLEGATYKDKLIDLSAKMFEKTSYF